MVNAQNSRGTQVVYTAYSLDPANLDGAAAQISGTWRALSSMDLWYVFMRQMVVNTSDPDFGPLLDQNLFVLQDYDATYDVNQNKKRLPFSVLLTDSRFNEDNTEIQASFATFDSNMTPLKQPDFFGHIPAIDSEDALWADLLLGISNQLPGSWYFDTLVTRPDGLFTYTNLPQADAIRQAAAACGIYFRYGVYPEAGIGLYADQAVPYITMARTPMQIVPRGWGRFQLQVTQRQTYETIEIVNYNTRLVDDGSPRGGTFFRSTEMYSVGNAESIEIPITSLGTPFFDYITQPVAVSTMIGGDPSDSCYVVTGSDGLVIPPLRWEEHGGRAEIVPGPSPKEWILKLTGADDPTLAPFTLSEGPDFPALLLGASQPFVMTDPKTYTLPTGVAVPAYNAPSKEPLKIDNEFIVNELQMFDAAVFAIASSIGPKITVEFEFKGVLLFNGSTSPIAGKRMYGVDEVIGSVFYRDGNYWRITSLTYDVDRGSYSGSAEQWNLLRDFDSLWDGGTVGDFDATYSSSPIYYHDVRPLEGTQAKEQE